MHNDYLQAYCDINDIGMTEDFLRAGLLLQEHPQHTVLNFARKGYVLRAFQEYLQWGIDLESFMQIGDFESTYPIYTEEVVREAVEYLQTKVVLAPKTFAETIVLVEQGNGDHKKKKLLREQLSAHGGYLFFI